MSLQKSSESSSESQTAQANLKQEFSQLLALTQRYLLQEYPWINAFLPKPAPTNTLKSWPYKRNSKAEASTAATTTTTIASTTILFFRAFTSTRRT